ncbi:DUF6630 family protein [Tenacibaculum haliotis]|uniref:DUF6630 family protein n=1 Tax=Tenacibaculum haliotis TaxID=1888914 RepID=UPI0021B03783|nr:hypothetical protein [Tenacibaculum haliotis]MCT4697561.1 hypothetical protein [Tenacibaculum haliotis]
MARIYYDAKKLNGEPFESSILNIESFRYIFENTNIAKNYAKRIDITAPIESSFFGIFKPQKEVFTKVLLFIDDIEYNSNKRNVYIPNSIILFDNEDYNFPSEFYFIARIENQVEIRKCNGGNNVKWFNIPDLHQSINDQKIIDKIENTFIELTKLVKSTFKIEKEKEKEAVNEKINIEKNRPLLNDMQKKAYQELTELCVFNNKKKKKILNFIETLKNYDNNSEYCTTLNYFMDFLDENDLEFIMRIDWKSEIENLEWLLNSVIKENYNLKIILPSAKKYGEDLTVSEDGIFEDFDKSLRKNELQLGFIDTQSDEYIAILHKTKDKEKIEQVVKLIGYEYYEK